MKFQSIRTSDAPAEIWQAFTDLRDSDPHYDDPMFDPLFARLIGEVRNDSRLGLAFAGDELVGVWPMHRAPGDWARPIGGPFADWHAPVLSRSTQLDPCDFLKGLGLAGMTVFGYRPRPGEPCRTGERVGANITRLSAGFDGFMAEHKRIHPKHAKKMRRLRRKLETDSNEVHSVVHDSNDVAFHRLIELKRQQFANTGRHDVLAPEWSRQLFDRLREVSGPRFNACLNTLYVDGKVAAAEFNLCSDKVAHGWITAFDRAFGAYAPGFILIEDMLRAMADKGVDIYDAGPWLDHYKKYYATEMQPVDIGVLASGKTSLAPRRLLATGWRVAEKNLPARIAGVLGQVRRRSDQILMSDTCSAARLRGFAGAARRIAN